MDTREYLPAFLAEAREHLQALGLAIVRIETEPDEAATTEQIFRIAHTLKGMSATMGFSAIATLTHAMEDVFELLRQRAGGLSQEHVDVLSACLDALEAAVEGIASGGAELFDPAPLVARLEGLARSRTPEQELDRVGGVALPDHERLRSEERRVVHVVVDLEPTAAMPGVRAYMVFAALAEQGELVGSVPAPDGVERFAGRRVEAWLATHAADAAVAACAAAIDDVAQVAVEATQPLVASEGAAAAPAARTGATVRVEAERLDELLHLMGELVIQRTAVEALTADVVVPGLVAAIQRLARSSQALQDTVTRVRMVSVETVFLRFPRLVRDLAAQLGKQVELRLEGQDTELDRTVVDALGDPLVHLVRNALDHGFEAPAEREAAAKPLSGTLTISARHVGGHVVVGVRDDGRGIDPAAVARSAFTRGLLDADVAAAVAQDSARAHELLFTPGFSTTAVTTELSGRGVGMDVVRSSVRALGGEVTLSSEPGVGTLAQIRLPLTLASVSALLVHADGLVFALPLDRVERTFRLSDATVRTVAGAPMLVLDDEVVPLLDAGAALGRGAGAQPRDYAVLLRGGERRIALAVAGLAGQRELVTRRLPAAVSPRAAAAGGAVLPDGTVALVVDCDALAASSTPTPAHSSAPVPLALHAS